MEPRDDDAEGRGIGCEDEAINQSLIDVEVRVAAFISGLDPEASATCHDVQYVVPGYTS